MPDADFVRTWNANVATVMKFDGVSALVRALRAREWWLCVAVLLICGLLCNTLAQLSFFACYSCCACFSIPSLGCPLVRRAPHSLAPHPVCRSAEQRALAAAVGGCCTVSTLRWAACHRHRHCSPATTSSMHCRATRRTRCAACSATCRRATPCC
jgi:hypothetical protein